MMQQTSLDAYFSHTKTDLNRNQKMVLEALEDIAPACNRQIAEHMKWPINSITPRILELRTKGYVVSAYIGQDVSGRKAVYWTLKRSVKEYADTY